jgi:recombination associated protein RdgC
VVGDECELRDPLEEGAVVRCKRLDLGSEEVANHLKAGMQVARLALEWQERIGLLLDQDLTVKRLRFLDLVQDEAAEVETEDAAARLDADFAIMSAEIGRFLPELLGLFGGMEPAEG